MADASEFQSGASAFDDRLEATTSMSLLPGIGYSQLSSEEEQDNDTKALLAAIIFCCLFIGIVVLVTFFIYGFDPEGELDEDYLTMYGITRYPPISPGPGPAPGPTPGPAPRPTAKRPTTPPPITPVVVPTQRTTPVLTRPVLPTSTTKATTTTELTTSTRTTTTQPTTTKSATATTQTTTTTITTVLPAVKELVCTVGHSAVVGAMYPPDKYCDYLYYCEVIIVGVKLRAKWRQSWAQFQISATEYKSVQLGVAFDYRHVTPAGLSNVRTALFNLTRLNISSYGVLNVLARTAVLKSVVQSMKDVFSKFREIQRSRGRAKTVIAIGLYDYSEQDAWDIYKSIIKEVANTYDVDTVIAISSTGGMENQTSCYAAPPVALRSRNNRFPSLVCFTPVHTLNTTDVWVQTGYLTNRSQQVVFLAPGNGSFPLEFQELSAAQRFRNRTAWLLFNVHLGDHLNFCRSAFQIVAELCGTFKGQSNC